MTTGIYEHVKALYDLAGSDIKRVGTGIREVDRIIRGPAPGEVCMFVGRSYTGKSIIGQNIIYHNRHLPSIFFSLEMPATQVMARLYSMWSDTPSADVQAMVENNAMPAEGWDMVPDFTTHRVIDTPGITVEEMSRAVQEYADDYGFRPEFAVVDYLELVGGAKASGEGYLATESQATMLKDWARTEKMRLFVIHQANKLEKDYMPPTPDSARNAGFTEADFVIGLWQPSKNPNLDFLERLSIKNIIAANVLKNRAFFESRDYIPITVTPSLRVWREDEAEATDDGKPEPI